MIVQRKPGLADDWAPSNLVKLMFFSCSSLDFTKGLSLGHNTDDYCQSFYVKELSKTLLLYFSNSLLPRLIFSLQDFLGKKKSEI